MKIELEKDIGINVLGKPQDNGQWWIRMDGRKIGLLNYRPNAEVQPLLGVFPHHLTAEIVQACKDERARLGKPSDVMPPMTDLAAYEAAVRALIASQEEEGATEDE